MYPSSDEEHDMPRRVDPIVTPKPADLTLTGQRGRTIDVNIRSLSEKFHDFYVTAEKDRNWGLYATRTWRREWERFRLTEQGENHVDLFAYANSKYVVANFPSLQFVPPKARLAQAMMTGMLTASGGGLGEFETFILEPLGNSIFGIRCHHNNKYVTTVLNEESRESPKIRT